MGLLLLRTWHTHLVVLALHWYPLHLSLHLGIVTWHGESLHLGHIAAHVHALWHKSLAHISIAHVVHWHKLTCVAAILGAWGREHILVVRVHATLGGKSLLGLPQIDTISVAICGLLI